MVLPKERIQVSTPVVRCPRVAVFPIEVVSMTIL